MDSDSVSTNLTVIVAVITASSGILGSFVGGSLQARSTARAAKAQAQAAAYVAGSERFARWQMHKREVYASLLEAMRKYASTEDETESGNVLSCITPALVVANSDLRKDLMSLQEDLSVLREATRRQELVEALMADVRKEGAAT